MPRLWIRLRAPRQRAWAALALIAAGCGSSSPPDKQRAAAAAEGRSPVAGDLDGETPEHEEANFAAPALEPPPAPVGTRLLAAPWLYVQSCSDPHGCVALVQPAGEAHCRASRLGGRDGWRLPTRAEAERFGELEGLARLDEAHWTRTADVTDPSRVWVVTPAAADTSELAARTGGERLVRCVGEP